MKKFDQLYKKIIKENEDYDSVDETVQEEENEKIDDILKLIKIDVSPAIEKLKAEGYIDGEKQNFLQQYVDESFSMVDLDDVMMNFELALIVNKLGMSTNDIYS